MSTWDRCACEALKVLSLEQYERGRQAGIRELKDGTGASSETGTKFLDSYLSNRVEGGEEIPTGTSAAWWAGWLTERWPDALG